MTCEYTDGRSMVMELYQVYWIEKYRPSVETDGKIHEYLGYSWIFFHDFMDISMNNFHERPKFPGMNPWKFHGFFMEFHGRFW